MHFWRLPWQERNAVLAEIHAATFAAKAFPQTIEATLIKRAINDGKAAMFCASVRSRRHLELPNDRQSTHRRTRTPGA